MALGEEAEGQGFTDGCCGCLYGNCPTEACAAAVANVSSGCLDALACPGVCENCVAVYQSWFCKDGLINIGFQVIRASPRRRIVRIFATHQILSMHSLCGDPNNTHKKSIVPLSLPQCDVNCGDLSPSNASGSVGSSSSCQSYSNENDPTFIGDILKSYRDCNQGLRMNCTAEDVLEWEIFEDPSCGGQCKAKMETAEGRAICQVDDSEVTADDDADDHASRDDDWFERDDDGTRYCPLSVDDTSNQEWRPCLRERAGSGAAAAAMELLNRLHLPRRLHAKLLKSKVAETF